jgi:methylamine utilization protein MauE
MSALASGLGLWPGVFLLAAGWAKARDGSGGRDTVVARALPGWLPLRPAWLAAAAVEVATGALVVSTLLAPWPEYAAATVLMTAVLVALWGVRNAPEAGCGCFGSTDETPVSTGTVVRAGVLAALALAAALGGAGWTEVFSDPLALAACAVVGAGLVAISPELRESLRRAAGSQRVRDAVCTVRRVPLEATLARLHRSELWSSAQGYLSSDVPGETWQEGCWRYVCYPARYDGERVTAVFALALRATPGGNAVAFVDEEHQRVLGEISGVHGSIKA